MSEQLDRFVEGLCELELDPQQLVRDPTGERWLPRELRRMARTDPACADELREFVEMELALFDVHEPNDAFFTRCVMDRLPEVQAVDDRRRTWILASAYALAIGVAYLLLGPALASGQVADWVEPIHGWYHDHAVEAGGLWMVSALLLVSFVLVVLPAGGRREHA